MGGLENYQTYFISSHLKNLECRSLISVTSKGCEWLRKEVKTKNLNERQICIYKLLLHECSFIQWITYDPIVLNEIYMWYSWDTLGGWMPIVCNYLPIVAPLIFYIWYLWENGVSNYVQNYRVLPKDHKDF